MMVAIDIKKYFLESKIEEDIYIRTPYILKTLDSTYQETKFSKLNRLVYVLFQAEKEFLQQDY